MQILIIGYGRMGTAVESACSGRDWASPVIAESYEALQRIDMRRIDVAVEFTRAPACVANYRYCMEKGVPVVTGTTGWGAYENEVQQCVTDNNGAFLHAANFSIGVHLFWYLAEKGARLFDNQPRYDVHMHEMHHGYKKDAPSGTAHHTAQRLLDNVTRKTHVTTGDAEGPLAPETLHVSASRGGYHPGMHAVYFDSPDDTVTLQHEARTRGGFANGALDCAAWLPARQGFFTITDYLEDILS